MTELILLLALVVQLRLRVTLISLSAAIGLLLFTRVTGYTYFQPFWPPVFLVITLVASDPATSPRTGTGRLVYGLALGLAMGVGAALLEENGLSDFYAKIIPVALVNLIVPMLDRIGESGGVGGSALRRLASLVAPRWNLAHMALWIALTAWGVRAKVIAPEIHAFWNTPLTNRGPDGAVSCASSPLFCEPFSFPAEARAWLARWRGGS